MSCGIGTRMVLTGVIVAVDLGLPREARAQSRVVFVPSVSVSSVFDDNPFATVIGSADQMTLVTPSIRGIEKP